MVQKVIRIILLSILYYEREEKNLIIGRKQAKQFFIQHVITMKNFLLQGLQSQKEKAGFQSG